MDRVKNEEVLAKIGEKRKFLEIIKEKKMAGTLATEEQPYFEAVKGIVVGSMKIGKRRAKMMENENSSYYKTKRLAEVTEGC